MTFASRAASIAPDVTAPDGSEVRLLCATPRGSMALFTLAPGTVARAVTHRSVEELWYFVSGRGRMWRALDKEEQTLDVRPGMSLTLPVGTRFQFRCDGEEPLVVVGTTMPPWPGDGEAHEVTGPWPPTV